MNRPRRRAKPPAPEPAERGDKRRKRILQALHDCIIDKGYAKTTLADIAQAADMSPSHLLYYYRGKDAILRQYFKKVADRIVERMEGFRGEPPNRQIELLAELFFAGKGIMKSEIGFMLECFGVAVHDRTLQREKSELDRRCKACLTELFEHTPAGASSHAATCAEIAYALLIGLRTAVYFDERLALTDVHRIFRSAMYRIAGLPQPV